tara:strand:- start:258 stop:1763 length:1506 start_codon:yes stop_codon:yes gene_type:complete
MKYIFLSAIFFILNYQAVYATENIMSREYFSEIHKTLQNNHYNHGKCVAFEIDDSVKGGIRYYESPKSNKRFKPNCNDVILFNDGDIYFGTYKQVDLDGKPTPLPNNLGVIKYKSGDMFIGEFIDGNINGSGILYIAESNSIYVGDKFNTDKFEWLNGLNLTMSGNCSLWDGSLQFFYVKLIKPLFYGNCENHPYKGNIVKSNGTWYGETQDMLSMSDIGVMTYDDGGIYDGGWKNEKRHGQGSYKKYSKDKSLILSQIGLWKNDKFVDSTEKSMTLIETRYGDSLFVGDIKDTKPHGEGKFIFKIGTAEEKSISGNWTSGSITYGTIQTSKYTYTGNIKKSELDTGDDMGDLHAHGNGTKRFRSGKIARGEFISGSMQKGFMQYPNGSKYEGQFTRGYRDGNGVLTQKDGTVIKDFWCMGKTKQDLQNEVGKLVSQSFMCYTKMPNRSIYKSDGLSHYQDQQHYVKIEKKSCSTLFRLKRASEKLLTICAQHNSDPYQQN